MDKIEKSLNDLSSPDKNTRYEACEVLRLADSLPETAIKALEAATQDPDPLVAEAARRALAALKTATYDPDPLVADAAKRALAIHRPPPPTENPPPIPVMCSSSRLPGRILFLHGLSFGDGSGLLQQASFWVQ